MSAIRLCGISFDVWPKLNADVKALANLDWTLNLMESDRKLLLEDLPAKLLEAELLFASTTQLVVEGVLKKTAK